MSKLIFNLQKKEVSHWECNLCQISCPTGALDKEYRLDSNKCISYWLQSPEIIPYEMRNSIGNRFYGCDECLISCPPEQSNKIKIKSNNEYEVNLEELLEAKNEVILKIITGFIYQKETQII